MQYLINLPKQVSVAFFPSLMISERGR